MILAKTKIVIRTAVPVIVLTDTDVDQNAKEIAASLVVMSVLMPQPLLNIGVSGIKFIQRNIARDSLLG